MTVSANVVKLEDGPRNAVFHLYAEVSGGDSEYNVKKVDITTLSNLRGPSIGPPVTHLALEKIQFTTQNVTVHIVWEGTPNARIWTCPPNFSDTINFRKSTPVQNNAPSRTGNVLLSTVNDTAEQTPSATALDGRYDLMLWFRKKYE